MGYKIILIFELRRRLFLHSFSQYKYIYDGSFLKPPVFYPGIYKVLPSALVCISNL